MVAFDTLVIIPKHCLSLIALACQQFFIINLTIFALLALLGL
jgi:hypothetical protein